MVDKTMVLTAVRPLPVTNKYILLQISPIAQFP